MPRIVVVFVLLGLCLPALARAQSPIDERIGVYVTAPVRDGFIDINKEISDSIDDLKDNMRKKRGIVLTKDAQSADVILRVVARGKVSHKAGDATLPLLNGIVALPLYDDVKVVRTVLEVGDFRKEFNAATAGYGDSAEEIDRQVHAWITANRDTLLARRSDQARKPE
jgi:hypothetical protein